jgi:hypothetical protein
VKEARIQEVMTLFKSTGFHLYSSNSNPVIHSHFSSITRDNHHSTECTSNPSHNAGTILISNIDIPLCDSAKPNSAAPSTEQQSPQNKSHSPTSGEVRILRPDLACVGLSDEFGVDHWGLKIVKLVAFPELIPSFRKSTARLNTEASLDAESTKPYLSWPSRSNLTSASILHTYGDGGSGSDSSSSEDDGYFSYSPQNASVASLSSNTSRSCSDLASLFHSPKLLRSPSKHRLPYSVPSLTKIHKSRSSRSAAAKTDSRVPFFSFTRTPEGSSLTADVYLLATLFPPHERHMVICSGELDVADYHLEGGDSSDECDEFDDLSDSGSYSLKCLQIDLQRFGLGMDNSRALPSQSTRPLTF